MASVTDNSWLPSSLTSSAIAACCCLGIPNFPYCRTQLQWAGISVLHTACADPSSWQQISGLVKHPLSAKSTLRTSQLRDLVFATDANRNSPLLALQAAVRIAKHRLFVEILCTATATSAASSVQRDLLRSAGIELAPGEQHG